MAVVDCPFFSPPPRRKVALVPRGWRSIGLRRRCLVGYQGPVPVVRGPIWLGLLSCPGLRLNLVHLLGGFTPVWGHFHRLCGGLLWGYCGIGAPMPSPL